MALNEHAPAMSGLKMATPVQNAEFVARALRLAGFTLAHWAVVGAALAIFMFLTVGASQACEPNDDLDQPEAGYATQIAAPSAATVSAVVESADLNRSGRSAADFGKDICCSCHCCPASPAAIFIENYAVPFGGNGQRLAILFVRTHLLSTEPDTPLRPPRPLV